eukprot:4954968-Alexandrium_andersonii.AAC.1
MEQSLPFSEVASHQASPSWYSLKADAYSNNVADMETLLRAALRDHRNLNKVARAWVGELCQCRHKVLICLEGASAKADKKLLHCLRHVDKSS